jgi:hypothetical protein
MRIRLPLLVAATGVAGVAAYRLALRPWWAAWGVDPAEAGAPLPGDDLLPAPDHVETRGIDVAAPPEAVWPWLVQMGYGRGGWYSYDRIDMKGGSTTRIHPDLQRLAVGDSVPVAPGFGFPVREIEPGHALVLYMDDEVAGAQRTAAAAAATGDAPPNVRASGAFLDATLAPRFAVSWAFIVEPRPGGSRLVERVRISMEAASAGGRASGALLGFGVFVMLRKQLLGIRDRAERLAAGRLDPASGSMTAAEAVPVSEAAPVAGPHPTSEPAPGSEPALESGEPVAAAEPILA